MVEARGLANSATKTVIALSRGSKIKTYCTCAPMWKPRPVWPASQNLSANRPRLAGAESWPSRGAAWSLIWHWRWLGVLEGESGQSLWACSPPHRWAEFDAFCAASDDPREEGHAGSAGGLAGEGAPVLAGTEPRGAADQSATVVGFVRSKGATRFRRRCTINH